MNNIRDAVISYIKLRVEDLEDLGKVYSEEKINKLADRLCSTGRSLDDIKALIDNKISNEVRKVTHNNHLTSLKSYYIASIDKIKKGNNCYLLSYQEGVKILEQAYLKDIKTLKDDLKLVSINNVKKGYRKANSPNDDYELIMSDIAYLLNIPYARTYRVFDENMDPTGTLNEVFADDNERFLTLEEAFRFVKEESSKFNLKSDLVDFHDRGIKRGLKPIGEKSLYKQNIDYVLNLFRALPDITNENYEELKRAYLNMKVFELLTNSLNNNLNNIGLIVKKKDLKYVYKLSPSYAKCETFISTLSEDETVCNFYIVKKKDLLLCLLSSYYKDIKEILNLLFDNADTLLPLISQILKEHLNYDDYNRYYQIITENLKNIVEEIKEKKKVVPDSDDDFDLFEMNNEEYSRRILPFVDNYAGEDGEKGSVLLLGIIAVVLFLTAMIIVAAVYALSKMQI